MSAQDFHEVTFKWPHPDASDVIVTGSFDAWSRSIHLQRTESGFQSTLKVPWSQKIAYKYIVDGRWTTTDTQATELDPMGNINNVYNAPARPAPSKVERPPAVLTPETVKPNPAETQPETVGKVNGFLGTAKETAVGMVAVITPGTTKQSEETPVQSPAKVAASPTVTETPTSAAVAPVGSAIGSVTEFTQKNGKPVQEPAVSASGSPPETQSQPTNEIASEALLSPTAKDAPVAPISILPLTPEASPPAVNGDASSEPLETALVNGSIPSEDKSSADVSTHIPVVLNGKSTQPVPSEVPLPPPTPAEVPLPATPVANGSSNNAAETSSTTSAPTPTPSAPSTPHKEKRHAFPTLGRHSRHTSSSTSVSEHGERSPGSPGKDTISSRMGSTKKRRTSSFFGKIKDIFHHEDGHHAKEKSEKK